MAEQSALEQAQNQLNELIESAKKGMIIPVRLPGQLEALAALLNQSREEQTAAAKKAAEAAVPGDAKSILADNAEFFKHAIHELRTPMTSIRGYADMMSNPGMVGELTEMQNQLLQVIRSNSRRMESLLSDMSYINKIRAGMLNVNPKMDTFKNIAMMVEKKTTPLAEELKRQIEFDIPSGLPLLTTDGELLSHAMFKLIENGLRYSAEGEGKVTVRGVGDGGTLVVTIADNGIGMTAEEVGKLGTIFFRSDNDTVRAYKGSGLGVPIAYGIIQGLDGTIGVESEQEKGTTFTIRLKGMT